MKVFLGILVGYTVVSFVTASARTKKAHEVTEAVLNNVEGAVK